jgi:hypothetical protein
MHGCHCNAPIEGHIDWATNKMLYHCTNCGCECYPKGEEGND